MHTLVSWFDGVCWVLCEPFTKSPSRPTAVWRPRRAQSSDKYLKQEARALRLRAIHILKSGQQVTRTRNNKEGRMENLGVSSCAWRVRQRLRKYLQKNDVQHAKVFEAEGHGRRLGTDALPHAAAEFPPAATVRLCVGVAVSTATTSSALRQERRRPEEVVGAGEGAPAVPLEELCRRFGAREGRLQMTTVHRTAYSGQYQQPTHAPTHKARSAAAQRKRTALGGTCLTILIVPVLVLFLQAARLGRFAVSPLSNCPTSM